MEWVRVLIYYLGSAVLVLGSLALLYWVSASLYHRLTGKHLRNFPYTGDDYPGANDHQGGFS